VHHDAKLEPYYTIQFRDGKEKQMDGKRLTPIEEKREGTVNRRSSVESTSQKKGSYGSSSEQPTDQCSSSSSEVDQDEEEDRFHKGQDAYYRSSSGEGGVTKIKIVEKISRSRYSIAFGDGTTRQVEGEKLAGLIDLTSKELASLMKEKNERHASTPNLRSSVQSKDSATLDQGYEPEAEPSSSENSYEDNIHNSPAGEKKMLSLPCAVQMVEAKTEDGGTRMVPLYKAEMDVYYRGPQGVTVAHIVKTHLDDLLEPYYTIRLEDGREKQTDNAHISLEKPEEEPEDEAEEEPVEEDVDADDWYQEWKESQIKQDQELRDEIKQYEEENTSSSAADSSTQEEPPKTPSLEKSPPEAEHSEHSTKEGQSEPELEMGKNHSHHGSERSEPRTASPVETPQVKKQDPDDSNSALVQASQFHVGDSVLYNSSKGDHMRATILKVRKDDKHRPYFVVKLSSGDEKKVYGHRLTPVRRDPERDSSRTRSRSRSVARRGRDGKLASSKRSTSVDTRRLSRRPSIDSNGSRDASVDRSRSSNDRRSKMERSRSMSRPPKEHQQSRGRRAESRDPRGRVHPAESKESRSRSKSVRATTRDASSKDSDSENRQRARSRSRAPGESAVRRPTISSRKAPMVMGVSHRVQHIGGDEGSTSRSKSSTSRFGKLKSSISSGISKAKQKSFDR
jgi:hypothetical protein